MAKKTVKQPPHLRVRIEPKLLARLEKAREANGNTLTGEIVARLEESFSTADKIALFKEAQEQRINELRQGIDDTRALIKEERERFEEERQKLRAEWAEDNQKLESEIDRLEDKHEIDKAAGIVVDALMGDDVATKEAVRRIAVLLAATPDWASGPDSIQKVTEAAIAAIKTAADKEAQK
jgi:hypothetical protein